MQHPLLLPHRPSLLCMLALPPQSFMLRLHTATEDTARAVVSRTLALHRISLIIVFAGISTGAWIGLTALELMQAVEREKRHAAFLNQQLETQRQLGKNEAEIEALQRQIREQNEKLSAMQSTLDQKK